MQMQITRDGLSRRPHKHVHSSLRCNQGARLDGVCPWSSLPDSGTLGPHPEWRYGQRGPTARWRSAITSGTRLAAGAWSSTSASPMTVMGVAATPCRMGHSRRTSTRLCILLRSARSIAIGNHTLTIRTFLFSPPFSALAPACTAIFVSSFSTGPPGDRGALHCHWRAIATQPIGLVPLQARGILPVAEEQRRTRGGQSGGVTEQPQCRGLCHSSSPSARSFTRSPSSPPPFTQFPFPPRSLVRDGQTSPHRPQLVVSRSTCPPISPSPHEHSFVTGTAVINNL